MKQIFRKMAIMMLIVMSFAFVTPVCLYAASLDDIQQGESNTDKQNGSTSKDSGDSDAISDYLQGYNPVTHDNMESAGVYASPIANALGTVTGFIMIVVSAAIFTITALDLAYIGVPPIRSVLDPSYGAGGQQGGMGMGMGMGGMGGMRGGMGGMGGMQGGGQQQGRRCWVSDEAKAAVQLAAGGMQGGMQGGMGMGAGMGMGMGGMQGGQQPQQSTKSVIFTYLKKRSFFLIIFALASVILMTSIFTDCGINLAHLLTKIISKFNGTIANVEV